MASTLGSHAVGRKELHQAMVASLWILSLIPSTVLACRRSESEEWLMFNDHCKRDNECFKPMFCDKSPGLKLAKCRLKGFDDDYECSSEGNKCTEQIDCCYPLVCEVNTTTSTRECSDKILNAFKPSATCTGFGEPCTTDKNCCELLECFQGESKMVKKCNFKDSTNPFCRRENQTCFHELKCCSPLTCTQMTDSKDSICMVNKPAPTEPSTDKPAPTELSTDKPAPKEPSTDKPAPTEPSTDKPPTEPSTDKPPTEPSTDKPPTEPSTDKPAPPEPSTDPPTQGCKHFNHPCANDKQCCENMKCMVAEEPRAKRCMNVTKCLRPNLPCSEDHQCCSHLKCLESRSKSEKTCSLGRSYRSFVSAKSTTLTKTSKSTTEKQLCLNLNVRCTHRDICCSPLMCREVKDTGINRCLSRKKEQKNPSPQKAVGI